MPARKRPPSVRGWTEEPPPAEPQPPRYHAHIGSDADGRLRFLGRQAGGDVQPGYGITTIAVVDIGRPFELRIPSYPDKGKSGLMIEGMTGANAEPWSPSMILAGARQGWFGFRLVDPDGSEGKQ